MTVVLVGGETVYLPSADSNDVFIAAIWRGILLPRE